jgi:hypothetical protein
MGWSPPAGDADWAPPAGDADAAPAAAPAAPADPTAGAGTPEEKYEKYYGYGPRSQDEAADFMAHPPHRPSRTEAGQMVGGLPRAAAGFVTSVAGGAASAGSHLAGAVMAPIAGDRAGEVLDNANERSKRWSEGVSNLANYVPTGSEVGDQTAEALLSAPGNLIKGTVGAGLKAVLPDNLNQAVGDVASGVGTDLMAAAVPGLARAGIRGVKAPARAVKGIYDKGFSATAEATPAEPAAAPNAATTPKIGSPVTGDDLRASPNPIPNPTEPPAPATHQNSETGGTRVAAPTEIAAPGASPSAAPEQGTAQTAPLGQTAAGQAERGSVSVFNSPKEEGPQETPRPEEQAQREQHIKDLNNLSGGVMPGTRDSAVSGDYNATGRDWQDKETNSPTMQAQLASENAALHGSMKNVHDSVGSQFKDKVDGPTLDGRGRTVRGALQGISDWFDKAVDGVYQTARQTHGDNAMPQFLTRAESFLKDDGNYMPDGFRKSALTRLNQLKTVGDNGIAGDATSAATPGSVGAAEKFRQWLNANRTLDNKHTVRQLVDHTDMDVAQAGGAGLFKTARAMKRHQFQMMEEPKLMGKLLSANDSQGINHSIPDHKVLDTVSEAATDQHQHLQNVLRAGAHLSPDLAKSSAQAIREIQGHMLSKMHDAATDDGGKWNARGFYTAADRFSRNVPAAFADRPDLIKHIQTINDAGNTLHMDKHYPGAVGQGVKATALGHIAEAGGKAAGSVVGALVPHVGHFIAKGIESGVEGLAGKVSETSREKAVASRIRPNERGSIGVLPQRDAVTHTEEPRGVGVQYHTYRTPNGGSMNVVEKPGLGIRSATTSEIPKDERGKGWGTRMLQRAVDDTHADGQVWRSDAQVSHGQVGAYKNLAQLGYDVKLKPHDDVQGAYQAHGDHVFEVKPRKVNGPDSQRGSVKVMNPEEPPPEEGKGSMVNVGLHQGQEGDKGFRKMSKQEAQKAVESTGAKVTKTSVLTPKQHGVAEPTAVMSTDRPLNNDEMQSVLAKTKQSAIPQRTDRGDESMHIAPGHEEIAKTEGWDSFNPEYFREHDGRTMTAAAENPKNIHPDSTVTNPKRSWPGIYDDPKEIMKRLGDGQPESPHLKEIFGKSREDLHDAAVARGDVEPKTPIPGIAKGGKGSAHAADVTNDANAERIRNIIQAYKEHDLSGYHGMVGWYEMDPMYHSIKKILGGNEEMAGKVYHNLNSYTSYASPMSSVGPEIRRGTAAATMAAEGNFAKFEKQGGLPQDKAKGALKSSNFELGNEGHAMHSTAHAGAMSRFNETGEEARAVKTGTYRRSGDAPSRQGSDHQNTVPVGDSHWSRGVGLADVRGAQAFDGSAEGPEMKVLHKWYHDEVARHHDTNLPSTSAQAVQWGALSKETGVESQVGAPKLEIWADKIAEAAKREGVAPKEMWSRIVKRLAADGGDKPLGQKNKKQGGWVGDNAQTKSPEFKSWFGDSKVTDSPDGGGKPLVVYHGTTHDFSKFSVKGTNPESDHGKGFYFSNETADVASNYAGKGPELTNKIELTAERLQDATGMSREKALARAHQKLMAHGGMTVPAYLRIEKPAIIGDGAHGKETQLTHDLEYENPNDPDSDIKGETGTLPKFMESLRSVAHAADPHNDGTLEGALAELHEKSAFSGLSLSGALKVLREHGGLYEDYQDDNGNSIGGELVRRALQKMGYDGIIDHTVDKKFGSQKTWGTEGTKAVGMKGMNPDTVHYVAFKPHQVKSAVGNSGAFSRKNADITAKNESQQNGAFA